VVAGPAPREEVEGRLLSAAPVAGPHLVESLRAAVRFAVKREPDAAMDICHSKIGGAPDLPQGTRWPMWTAPSGERRPMQFFAQVNLADATAKAPGPLDLPSEGHLSFFADYGIDDGGITGRDGWETGGSVVLYSAPGEHFVRCSPRIAPLPSGELMPLGVWTWSPLLPDGVAMPDAEARALDALHQAREAELRGEVPDLWFLSGRHQLGGHVRFVRRPQDYDVVGTSAEWRLLLQLDSEPIVESRFGEGGDTLWWAARVADISAGVWDQGRFTVQAG
jgi:hypothetical protein